MLEQRECVAFQENVLEDEGIAVCATYGAEDSGDARKELNPLLEAGDVARENESDTVSEFIFSLVLLLRPVPVVG